MQKFNSKKLAHKICAKNAQIGAKKSKMTKVTPKKTLKNRVKNNKISTAVKT